MAVPARQVATPMDSIERSPFLKSASLNADTPFVAALILVFTSKFF